MALHFVLMLTERDVTIPDLVDVYDRLDVDSLRHVAFKDVGVDRHTAQALTDAAHADGRSVLLELADLSDRGQQEGFQLALDLGVDRVVARWRPEFADAAAAGGKLEYWPFVGALSGSPLALSSTPDELAAEAAGLGGVRGVDGLVLMPYRQTTYDAAGLLERTAAATALPVMVAGGVRDAAQIHDVAAAGGWGFTMGGAALADRHTDPTSVTRRVADVLRLCGDTPVRPLGPVLEGGRVK